MDIWLNDRRFHVRDQDGRHVAAILEEVSSKRGLGAVPRSIEEIMDMWSQARDTGTGSHGVTDLYGDRRTGQGLVLRGRQAAWPMAADELAPAAEQILAGELDEGLKPRKHVTRLGRPCTEYHGFLEGEERGVPYKSEVTRVVSPPYLLFSHVSDAQNPDHHYTTEVISLEEGVVGSADPAPPTSSR